MHGEEKYLVSKHLWEDKHKKKYVILMVLPLRGGGVKPPEPLSKKPPYKRKKWMEKI